MIASGRDHTSSAAGRRARRRLIPFTHVLTRPLDMVYTAACDLDQLPFRRRLCKRNWPGGRYVPRRTEGEPMKTWSTHGLPIKALLSGLVALSFVALSGAANGGDRPSGQGPVPLTVPKATCGPNDHPETGLQGQVPAALRAAGFKGFNCNLELIGQSKGDGANWQTAEFRHGHARVCAYHGTASPTRSLPTRNPANFGVPVIDITNPSAPTPTGHLQTISMLDPWESLKVNERRQLLGADNGQNGAGGPEVDIYDVSSDCRFPQLLASLPVGTGTDGGGVVTRIIGHEGAWAPDGLTYYGGGRTVPNNYYAVDTSDPTRPKLLAAWFVPRVSTGAR